MTWDDVPEWAQAVARSLLQTLKERDPYSYGHCRRVAWTAKQLAAAAGLSEREQRVIEFASMFHDLGKLGMPDVILLKPGRLTPAEEEVMRLHPQKSLEIIHPLTVVDFFKRTCAGVLHHHERPDGRGYPHRLKGDAIPLHARIILIADTYDAMTTSRPYRKRLSQEQAFKELKIFSGRQFDSKLVKIFLQAHPGFTEYEEEITEEFVARNFKRAA